MISVTPVPRGDIPTAWPDFEDWIRQGYQATGAAYDSDFVYRELMAGRRWLWIIRVDDVAYAAAVTTITGFTISILSLGGVQMTRWLFPALEAFTTMCRKNGLDNIEIDGRKGWQRALPGFKHARTVLRKAL